MKLGRLLDNSEHKPVTHQAGGLPDDGGYVCHENAV
jgi:hypothetical protein